METFTLAKLVISLLILASGAWCVRRGLIDLREGVADNPLGFAFDPVSREEAPLRYWISVGTCLAAIPCTIGFIVYVWLVL